MKRYLCMPLVLLYVFASAQIGTINHLDEKHGYFYIKLGDTVASLKGKTVPEIGFANPDSTGVAQYMLKDNNLLVAAGIRLFDNIGVDILAGKIYQIQVYYNKSFISIYDILNEAYGSPSISSKNNFSIYNGWIGKTTAITWTHSALENNHYFTISDIVLSSKWQKNNKLLIKKQASNF